MSSRHYKGPNSFTSNSSRHYKGPNPFTDPKNESLFKATVDECNQMKGKPPQQTQTNDTNSIRMDPSNPYLNDPNLQVAMQQFNPFANQQYEQAHSARSNGYNHHNNHNNNNNSNNNNNNNYNNNNYYNNNYNNNNYNNYNNNGYTNTAKSHQSQELQEEEKNTISVRSDNPYHPTNFYKDKEEEQKTAKYLVNKFRVDEIKRDAVVDEYAAFLRTLPSMNMINEDVDNDNNLQDNKRDYKLNNNNVISPSNSIISNDMIPGQIAINTSNFNQLYPNDTVWIRNDDTGDWEIYTVIKMERTNVDKHNAYIGTFKMGNKERIIWQDQCRDFTMAKFIKENDNNNIISPTSKYVINNIFKINGNGFNGNFVLKEYNELNGMASMKDVRTGKMVNINLRQTNHVML